ncbi:MAG: sigma-70 family RNA polymerase sigma factor [Lachnospiraceae bacterium]|nr:sigma-70 family RNA polymerase sigma factor [Lachnospiraceae bacterium]
MDEIQAKRLVDTYSDMLLRIGISYLKNKCDAEDICQSVLLKYIQSDVEFECTEHEKAWLIRTAINTCKNLLKTAYRKYDVGIDEVPEAYTTDEYSSEMLDIINRLPQKHRICIYLYYYEGYSAKEISGLIGKGEVTVRQYLSRARKRLRDYLSEDTDENKRGVNYG